MKSPFALAAVLFSTISLTFAHNNYFLPGDSFFSLNLTRKVIDDWSKNETDKFTFDYQRLDGSFMACGNLGYTKIQLINITPSFKNTLIEAYWRFTSSTPATYQEDYGNKGALRQINGLVALIHNRDFDGILGLKYNEDWKSQGKKAYSGLFESAHFVVTDWLTAEEHRALDLQDPPEADAHLPEGDELHTSDETLTIDVSKIKITLSGFIQADRTTAISTCPNLEKIAGSEAFSTYTTVYDNQFEEHGFDHDQKKQLVVFDMPISEDRSRIPESYKLHVKDSSLDSD